MGLRQTFPSKCRDINMLIRLPKWNNISYLKRIFSFIDKGNCRFDAPLSRFFKSIFKT
ncbi:hypothetical protein D3C72_1199310 [compost metagenome]